jgi:uncharacterized protein (DUF927 family)
MTIAERIILQHTGAVDHAQNEAGSLGGWWDQVAALAAGNSRLVLALSTAFAAPLLYPTGSESGGFHFRGPSSVGKSTALVVAGSAWGGGGIRGYVRSWRATANGLEGVAALHCDGLLCLDEISEVDPKQAGEIAYMLANGVGKSRAGRSGDARRPAEWRLLFLSSGEMSLADKIAEDGRGRRARAGQEVRVVDILADAGAGLGLFEDLHGFQSADAFARHLKEASGQHYGHPMRAYLQALVDGFDDIAPTVKGHVDGFLREQCDEGADGQVKRVARRFGLAAAGGEMATALRLLPWNPGEATSGAARCFKHWIEARGGSGSGEEREHLSRVRGFIEANRTSRFEEPGSDLRVINSAGVKHEGPAGLEYVIFRETWEREVCAGLGAQSVAHTLAAHGFLRTANQGGKVRHCIKVSRTVSGYAVRESILGGDQ